jgi:hypothetical protein
LYWNTRQIYIALGSRTAEDKYASAEKARFPHAQVVAHV